MFRCMLKICYEWSYLHMTNVFKHIVKIILVIDFCKVICITIRYCENRKECILISLMQSDKMHKNKYSNNIKKDMYVRKKMCIKNMHISHQILIHLSVSFRGTVGRSCCCWRLRFVLMRIGAIFHSHRSSFYPRIHIRIACQWQSKMIEIILLIKDLIQSIACLQNLDNMLQVWIKKYICDSPRKEKLYNERWRMKKRKQ